MLKPRLALGCRRTQRASHSPLAHRFALYDSIVHQRKCDSPIRHLKMSRGVVNVIVVGCPRTKEVQQIAGRTQQFARESSLEFLTARSGTGRR